MAIPTTAAPIASVSTSSAPTTESGPEPLGPPLGYLRCAEPEHRGGAREQAEPHGRMQAADVREPDVPQQERAPEPVEALAPHAGEERHAEQQHQAGYRHHGPVGGPGLIRQHAARLPDDAADRRPARAGRLEVALGHHDGGRHGEQADQRAADAQRHVKPGQRDDAGQQAAGHGGDEAELGGAQVDAGHPVVADLGLQLVGDPGILRAVVQRGAEAEQRPGRHQVPERRRQARHDLRQADDEQPGQYAQPPADQVGEHAGRQLEQRSSSARATSRAAAAGAG